MKKSPIALAVAAAIGAGTAEAEVVPLVLISEVSLSANGFSNSIVSNSTATWSYETTTGVVTGAGLYKTQTQINPVLVGQLFTRDLIDPVLGGGNNAAATNYECIEGIFGGGVGASLCGNYNFGTNYLNESTTVWGPGTGVMQTIGGDDNSIGNPQSIAQYDGMTTTVMGDDVIIDNQVIIVPPDEGMGYRITFTRPGEAVDDPNFGAAQGSSGNVLTIGANDLRWPAPAMGNMDVTGPPMGSDMGTFSINSDPDIANVTVTYAPAAGFVGTETWVYTVTDTSGTETDGWTDDATVTVTVSASGTANDDMAATTRLLNPVAIAIGQNDVGFADPSTVMVTSNPAQGTATVSASPGPKDGIMVTYQSTAPLGSAPYFDTFTYNIDDGSVDDDATVTITVNNMLPVAGDLGGVTLDTQGVSPSAAMTDVNVGPGGDIAGNMLGDPPSVVTTTPANDVSTAVTGTIITITASTFTSAGDAVGYTITDADGEAATGTIAVSIPDVIPTVGDDTPMIVVPGPTEIAVSYTLGNGAVSDHMVEVTGAQWGTVTDVEINEMTGQITFLYTPTGFAATDTLTVSMTDGDGSVGTGTVTLTITGAAVTIEQQNSLPGTPNSKALGPIGLGALLVGLPLLRARRRKR